MNIYGNIALDPAGSQIANLRLENLASAPLTSDGRIYFDTSAKKVFVWNGTSWLQITSSADYLAGDGLYLTPSNIFNISLYDNTANTSGLQFNGGFLQLKVVPSELQLDGSGLSIATSGVTAAHLAGSIPDSKLLQIVSSSKVAASAVEPVFLRNDMNQTTIGTLTMKDIVLVPEAATPSSVAGKIYYNIADNKLYYYNTAGWVQLYTGTSNINSITASLPISITPATGDVNISIALANTTTNGYLSAVDWNIFNSKQSALTFGNGIDYTAPLVSVKLATDPGLEFDGFGALQVKLNPTGGILKDATGLYLNAAWSTSFQTVYNSDPTSPNAHFQLASGGSFEIRDNTNVITLFKVDDGTVGTSTVTASNLIVQGNLDVNGAASRLDTTELYIRDRSISVGWQNPSPYNFDFTLSSGTPTVGDVYSNNGVQFECVQVVSPTLIECSTVTPGLPLAAGTLVFIAGPGPAGDLTYTSYSAAIPTDNSSFDVLRGSLPTVNIRYNESTTCWEYTNDGTIYHQFNTGIVKYTIPFTNLLTVNVIHNLNDPNPVFQCYDSTGKVINPLEITNTQIAPYNTAQVTFDSQQTGVIAVVGGSNSATGGGSSGKYTEYFNLGAPGAITITAAQHGLGTTDLLMVQVMSYTGYTATIIQPDSTEIDQYGTVTMTFLGAINGKVIIMK